MKGRACYGAGVDASQPPRPRRPQARVRRNDARVIEGALARADERGWAGLRVAAIAAEVGLSHRTVQQRFPTRAAIAIGVWTSVWADALQGALERLIAVGDDVLAGGDPSALEAALQGFDHPAPEHATALRAAAEVLIAAEFTPSIHDAVAASLGSLRGWRDAPDEVSLVARAFLLSAALGALLARRGAGEAPPDWRGVADAFASNAAPSSAAPSSACRADVTPAGVAPPVATPDGAACGATPPASATASDAKAVVSVAIDPPTFPTGDPRHDALLQATLDDVAAFGVDEATVANISARIGVTQGFLFGRYGTKRDLIVAALTGDAQRTAAVRAATSRARQASSSDGIALAFDLRARAHPEGERRRRLDLAWTQSSWHEPIIHAATTAGRAAWLAAAWPARKGEDAAATNARHRTLLALDLGVALLAKWLPEGGALAYEIVTVPWLDLTPAGATPPSL